MRQVEVGVHLELGDLVGHVQERLRVHDGEKGKKPRLLNSAQQHHLIVTGKAEFGGWVMELLVGFGVGRCSSFWTGAEEKRVGLVRAGTTKTRRLF